LYSEQNDQFVLYGKGIIYLSDAEITIVCSGNVICMGLNKIGAVTIESYCRLQLHIPHEKHLYQVTLEDESVIKWQDTIILLMEKSGLKKPITR
jgi:hypothetical protein